ncbi:citrate transporter [Rhodomicrobium vannielii ATCC 17100]|uniref:Citrate transporter n=1 Tax=Rhodomicrobium vannielii (strain ATCC 17100 / DSM 162 / LMG 4299 / NCIMB 10020 / ATH 3.1.1) TaxID=648757 RepID=E3I1G8_RHOVT|nr:sodium:proton antiporter [Rhodomicrobium vannielii]ADP71259.1 citrate transporter [Rhodomicrobium vannielii ATCC 17100]
MKISSKPRLRSIAAVAVLAGPTPAMGAGPSLDGAGLSLLWCLPFAGVLLSLAILPMVASHFWHRRQGLVALAWALLFLVPFASVYGSSASLHQLLDVALLEYIPFIVLIGSLYTIAGGIWLGGSLSGSPGQNTAIMAAGTGLASLVGTTGAAMIFIRPLMRANRSRTHQAHLVIFFIFLVCNVGGALTPLGDPPLFLGYLKGVPFSWPFLHLWPHTLLLATVLLAWFYVLDRRYYKTETPREHRLGGEGLKIWGIVNLPLIAGVVFAVAASGTTFIGPVDIAGVEVRGESLVRDAVLVVLAVLSLALTPLKARRQNEFNWAPVLEVAKLFAAIFVTIVPAIAILKAGEHGAAAPLFAALGSADAPNHIAYFWLTGLLSSFLDNAPSYLVFFNAAGGDPVALAGPLASTLAAISAGAVFMGALTYIGNAPNFMVRAIAEHQGIKMPSFFGFMLWSGAFMIPPLLLITAVFFAG